MIIPAFVELAVIGCWFPLDTDDQLMMSKQPAIEGCLISNELNLLYYYLGTEGILENH